MRHITIFECYDSITISNKLEENTITEKEADELEKYIRHKGLDVENIIFGRNTVTFINYVGYIKLSSVDIEILPKVDVNSRDARDGRKAILNMLFKCNNIDVNISELGSLNLYNMNLNEILAYIFAHKLQIELSRGGYKEYIYVEEDLHALKGSLVIKGQISNIAKRKPKVCCRYEEFSIDNSLNQMLNYCVKILLSEVKRGETIKILRHIQASFGDVTERYIENREFTDYRFTRLNNRFREVFILAGMIIKGNSTLGESGNDKAFSVLFKMNEVFEAYISKLLSRYIDEYTIYSQHSKYRLLVNEETDRGIFQLKPDIVIEKNGIEEIIIDTKWKRIDSSYNRHGVKRDDLYQMYAYLTRYTNVKKVILLYPNNSNVKLGDKSYLESWYLDNDKDKKIRIYTVNLENEEKTVSDLINIITDD